MLRIFLGKHSPKCQDFTSVPNLDCERKNTAFLRIASERRGWYPRSMLRSLCLAIPFCFSVFAGCGSDKIAEGSEDGARIYNDACARCHGENGEPSKSMISRTGVRSLKTGRLAGWSDEQIRNRILNGSSSRSMPSFKGALTDKQLDALVVFVRGLQSPKQTAPAPAR